MQPQNETGLYQLMNFSVKFLSATPPVSSVAVGAGIWVFFGWLWWNTPPNRRGQMLAGFGLVTTAAFAGGLVGSLLVSTVGLSSLGAIAGAALAMAGWSRAINSNQWWLIDGMVPAGIAGLSVARVGCLFDGCDFGRIAEWGPAVAYGPESRAWEVHVAEYGLGVMDTASYAVHPFAAYLAGWGLMSAVVGEWLRRRSDRSGNAAVATALLFLAGGGAVEWLREPATVPPSGTGWTVYPFVYWLGTVVIGAAWWWFNKRLRNR